MQLRLRLSEVSAQYPPGNFCETYLELSQDLCLGYVLRLRSGIRLRLKYSPERDQLVLHFDASGGSGLTGCGSLYP